jgi:molybdenum cofactor guanylyltransferase
VREHPPGGGPVPALRAGLAAVPGDVVAVLAADLPFLTTEVIGGLRERLSGDGVLVVDPAGRDQLLLGVWRTSALRSVTAAAGGRTSMRTLLAPLAVQRWRPAAPADGPAPWTDCDTPADLARARTRLSG